MHKQVNISEPFDLSKIDANNTHISFDASQEERDTVNENLKLEAILSLQGEIWVRPWHKTGFMLEGTLRATVRQICVVTLDSFDQKIETPFEQSFLPAAEAEEETADVEVDFNLESEDPPDALDGHTLDLLTIVSEHLALSLDPYPRKPGASIDPSYQVEDEVEVKDNPFSVLKQLKE